MTTLELFPYRRLAELDQGIARDAAGWEAAVADAVRLHAEVEDLHLRLDRAEALGRGEPS